jgi:dimethylargininase
LKPIAFTRDVPESIVRCELTHLSRAAIDLGRARREHLAFEAALAELGYEVRRLPTREDLPDSVFVEDTAIVLDGIAVLARPGAASRRPEVDAMRDALRPLRTLAEIEPPGTLDGGDVLVLGPELVVGLSGRTSAVGAEQLARHVESLGCVVRMVPVRASLHLKSAVTRVGEETLLVNPQWIDPAAFRQWRLVECDPAEPFAANALWAGGAVIHAAEFPGTRARLERAGCRVIPVPARELAKAEGGVTCCSVLVPAVPRDANESRQPEPGPLTL